MDIVCYVGVLHMISAIFKSIMLMAVILIIMNWML